MKVFVDPPNNDRGLHRIGDALKKYKTDNIEIVNNELEADLVVLYAYGRHDTLLAHTDALKSTKRAYALIQTSLRSTKYPSTIDWFELWKNAKVVWSTYDLFSLCDEDGTPYPSNNIYYAPFGTDFTLNSENKQETDFVIAASSQGYLVESARECILASRNVGKKVFYLGKELNRGVDVVCKTGIPDWELTNWYSRCDYVSGLRRTEGFEFPVLEGALCGARPILFDKPHYRYWFNPFGLFIPEEPREQVIESLTKIFSAPAAPRVSETEKKLIKAVFDWKSLVGDFYKRCES